MKRFVILLVLTTSAAVAQKIQVQPFSRDTLGNGLVVMLMEYRKVPLVHLRLVARGGSAHDPDSLAGLASLAATLMREGTKTRTATEIAEAIDFIGGSLSVSAGQDYCAANAQMLAKDLETGLGLFADVLLNPVFSQREIDREREQRRAALESIKEEASGIASLVFNKSVYGLHPYGRQTLGTRRSLAEITRDDLVAFHEKVFVPDNAILVAVGDFQSATMLQRIQETFGAWPRGVRPQWNISSSPGVSGRKVTVVDKPDATQTQIRVGNVGIDIRNPDRFALEVASTVFGGGFTSRLVEEIRVKRSLTYGAWCGFPMNLYGGSYVIGTFTKNETLAETIDVILAELSKLRERGVTKEELQKAQNYLAGDFARGLQTPEALASQISDIELYGFPGDYLETYIQNIRNVQLAEVSTVIKKYFRFDDLVFVLVGPADKACAGVEKYGIVNTMTLDEVVE